MLHRFVILAGCLAVLGWALASGAEEPLWIARAAEAPQVGKPAPGFTLKTPRGETLSLADFRGKTVVLNFWATWCPPCREEMPSMEALYRQCRNQPFAILAVSEDRDETSVKYFLEEMGLTFPVLLDKDTAVGRAYRVLALPTTYVIGPDGKIKDIVYGGQDWNSPRFRKLVERHFPKGAKC